MPLSADAKALLELLLTKGQSYDDIASLLGASEGEVRSRAREALTELCGADPDANVALSDWILGQADPIGRADAARHLRDDRGDHRLASELIGALREIAPGADFPKLPGEPSGGRLTRRGAQATAPEAVETPKPERDSAAEGPLSGIAERRARLLVVLGIAGVLLVAVVLGVAGVFGGGEEEAPSGGAPTDTTAGVDSGIEGSPSEDVATIPFSPVGGSDASGTLSIGVVSDIQAFMEIAAENLQPAPQGSIYFLWFTQDEKSGYPYQAVPVSGSGEVNERYALPRELLGAALASKTADIWISPADELRQRIPEAVEKGDLVEIPGERVLTAPIERIARAAGFGGEQDQ